MINKINYKKISFYTFIFIFLLLFFIVKNNSGQVVEFFLAKNKILLENYKGGAKSGSFDSIIIKGKKYPLKCLYNYEEFINYKIECPNINLKLNISLNFSSISINKLSLDGNFSKESGRLLLSFLRFPKVVLNRINGSYSFYIKSLVIKDKKLSNLNLNGELLDLSIKGVKEENLNFNKVLIKTIEESNPILISTKGEGSKQFSLSTKIHDNKYQTEGEISGEGISRFKYLLNIYGKQIEKDEWQIYFSGRF